jgi:hypothetical protein
MSSSWPKIPKTGKTQNKFQTLACFQRPKKHHTKHHDHHAFHHKLTTFLPAKNTRKSQNPLRNHLSSRQNIFLQNMT